MKIDDYSDNKCTGLDAHAACLYPGDAVLLSVNKERNTATTYKYSLVDTASNAILNQVNISHMLVLNEKGKFGFFVVEDEILMGF